MGFPKHMSEHQYKQIYDKILVKSFAHYRPKVTRVTDDQHLLKA